jgi:uncharacterized protein (TIGR02996 family)
LSDTTERELHAAILAAPDDDGPRLIYADWLVQEEDPRGEVIQLDFAIQRLKGEERVAAVRRRAELVCPRHATWAPYPRQRFARGFIDEIELDRPVARGPLELVRIALVRTPTMLSWLDDVPTIEELRLANDPALIAVLASRRPARLRTLQIADLALVEPLPAKLLVGLERIRLDKQIVIDQVRAALEAAAPTLRDVRATDPAILRWAHKQGIAATDFVAPETLPHLSFAGDRPRDIEILNAVMKTIPPARPIVRHVMPIGNIMQPFPPPPPSNPMVPFPVPVLPTRPADVTPPPPAPEKPASPLRRAIGKLMWWRK